YGDRGQSGERRPYGDCGQSGERRPYGDRGQSGERRPSGDRSRSGDRPFRGDRSQSDRRSYGDRRDSADRGSFRDRPRGGVDRPHNEYAPVRERIPEPPLPDEITARDLNSAARNELKTLSKENAEQTARHLAMAAQLIDDEPERAHEHALAASRRAGRIAVVRETLAITAYRIGDFALALRELRTYRRISGKDDMIALIVDSERGVGRPDRALEEGRGVDRAALSPDVRVALAIAMSGARLDRGETELALGELEIPELDPDRAFEWSPALFSAQAAVLEDLGRTEEAAFWAERAEVAASVLGLDGQFDEMIVEDGLIEDDEFDDDEPGTYESGTDESMAEPVELDSEDVDSAGAPTDTPTDSKDDEETDD
ncbi:MAG TPA: primosomal protein, partial [Microbacterium sp.]|nr:primosomal protein [Microbacterium sp.]